MLTIYLDAVWLLNFFLDWMILLLTHSLSKSRSPRYRLALGAVVASLLVPLNLFYPSSLWATPAGKGLFSLLIIFTSFGYRNIRLFARRLFLFYFVTFSIGGGLFGLYYFLNEQIFVSSGVIVTYQTGFGDGISWLFVLIGFPIVWIFSKRRMDQLVVQKIKYDEILPVSISVNNHVQQLMSFVDSGNQLVDPITKQPVIICDEAVMKGWFKEEEWENIHQVQQTLNFELIPEGWTDKFRIVPYQGVGGTSQFMLVLKPDWIRLTIKDNPITVDRVLIGIQFGQLSPDESYQCLLHPHLLKSIAVDSA
ncbi:sigma-E processing peptidase SpoIIGA [Pontibacillus salipaludis]|uniref:sigma-E processing peptidase SpoIIGA n=1 Tax=Pontibacillus salipaludis TaxID=1697394 RepID=UPI001669DB2B|nr:sigma-E processing peptidase SpoIIGA [Pontibacillus salipaludis]